MKGLIKNLKDLTKIRLVYFVQITALCGYFLGLEVEQNFSWIHFFASMLGISLITMGSFALNQWQEVKLDSLMPRTKTRPIPDGRISKRAAFQVSWALMIVASPILYWVSLPALLLSWLTVFLYNFLYTRIWKPKWVFGAVPGALPGAMPVVLGYAAIKPDFLTGEILYLFLIMFLWQMPHFWSLAIRYQEDYKKGSVPVLPSILGNHTTLYHMGLYLFVYVALALAAPWFVMVHLSYYILILPFSLMVLWNFIRFYKANGEKYWLSFFLWINFSMLAYLVAPVIDKWYAILFR